MNIKKIPIQKLKEMDEKGFIEITPYIHKNSLVRWLFWRRLETALNFSSSEKRRVLDFGAGSGVFMPALAEKFKEVHSLDRDTRALKHVKKLYSLKNVNIKESHGDLLPYKSNFFDVIFATDVLEHFKDSTGIQNEFSRVLKNKGCLIVSGPTENIFYKLARKLMYKRKKPFDHYTDINQVMDVSSKIFKIKDTKTLPLFLIPGFKIYKAEKWKK